MRNVALRGVARMLGWGLVCASCSGEEQGSEALGVPGLELEMLFELDGFDAESPFALAGTATIVATGAPSPDAGAQRKALGRAAPPAGAMCMNVGTAAAAGAAWYDERVDVAAGFQVRFTMQFAGQGASSGLPPGGDGMAFVIRNSTLPAVGPLGCSMGYRGLPRSVAVELDTYDNRRECGIFDPNGNHVDILLNPSTVPGDTSRIVSAGSSGTMLDVDLKDQRAHEVEVRYAAGMLSVFVDDMETPRVARPVDLVAVLETTDAAIGFTSATASAWEEHCVLRMQAQVTTTTTCPLSGWAVQDDLSAPGMTTYRRTGHREYLTVLDLSMVSLHNLIDRQNPPAPGHFLVHDQAGWVALATCPTGQTVRMVRNGAFGAGASRGQSTNVSHGVVDSASGLSFAGFETPQPGECDATAVRPCCPGIGRLPTTMGGSVLTCRSNVPASTLPPLPGCWRHAEEFRALSWDSANRSAAVVVGGASSGPDAVGGFHPSCVVSGNSRPRNFAGIVNEPVTGGPAAGALLLYSGSSERTPEHVQQCLENFGATRGNQVQLDGGGSVFLTINGTTVISEVQAGRQLTHAMVVCGP